MFLKSNLYDYNNIWILENTEEVAGGRIMWGSSVYIRNATIGKYLDSDWTLSDLPNAKFALVAPHQTTTQAIPTNSEMFICHAGMNIAADEKES